MSARIPLFLLFILMSSVYSSTAQCPSDLGQLEITASYGHLPGYQLAGRAAGDYATAGRSGKQFNSNTGPAFITARYFFYNRLAFGFTFGTTVEKGQNNDRTNPSTIISTYSRSQQTIAAELYYIYLFRKYVEVYTLLGAGPAFISTVTETNATATTLAKSETDGFDAIRMHYSPLGVRVGARLGAFAEVGIGYKGLVSAGLSFKFGQSCWWK